MELNIGRVDRFVRICLGAFLFCLAFVLPSNLKFISLFGLIPILTAFVRWCPLYTLFGIRTCSMSNTK